MAAAAAADREERRFAEVPRESVKLVAESAGVELGDDVAALLAEDVCYRLREATQSSSQFMRHAKRRKLTVEDFNRALRPSVATAPRTSLPFRSIKEGELFFVEDRDVNLVELALATNIPKVVLRPMVRVPSAVQTLSDDLLKYYQQITRAILGEDPHLMKSNSKMAALLPYFVYVISGVKSVSHDLEQLNRLLHMVKSLIQNPYLYLGSYVRSLVSSVMYCILEPLAASINPLNDHWTLRDYAALLLSHIFWFCRTRCAVERVLYPHLPAYWANLQAVLDDYSVSNAQVKADGHKVYGAILVAVERLLQMKALSLSQTSETGQQDAGHPGHRVSSPGLSPPPEPLSEAALGIASHLQAGGAGCPWEGWRPVPLPAMYGELYSFFGDSLAVRFSTGPEAAGGAAAVGGTEGRARAAGVGGASSLPYAPPQLGVAAKEPPPGPAHPDTARKMPQLTANLSLSPPRQDGSPRASEPAPPSLAATGLSRPLPRSSSSSSSLQRSRAPWSRASERAAGPSRDVFPKARFTAPPAVGGSAPAFAFLIGGRQMGRRCQGRRPFLTAFAPGAPTAPSSSSATAAPPAPPPLPSLAPRTYAHKLPVIGRVSKPVRRWACSHYSLHLPL
ncbi:hypothetical protein CRUP_028180 [Coryphaenoides rupestris]|nr:hypothetical protein CRUP_028180 [Coryphaenoides rupestris]